MRLLLLALAALAALPAAAQSANVSPFATQGLPLSAEAQAVSDAGSFGGAYDPAQFLRNPAVLADFTGGVSVGGMHVPHWLIGDIQLGSLALAGSVQTTLAGWPATVGAGLAYGAISYGSIPRTTADSPDPSGPSATADARDDMAAFGVGLGVEGPVRVRAGAGARRLRSASDLSAEGEDVDRRARALTGDLGVDVTAPVGTWIQPTPTRSGLQFALDASAGTALRGLVLTNEPFSDEIYTRPDRLVSAGVGLLVGLDVFATTTPIRAASLELLAEGETRRGRLTPGAVFLGTGSDEDGVTGRRAARVTYGETLGLSLGHLGGSTYVKRWTGGVTLSLGGATRLAGALTSDRDLYSLGQRFDVRYTYALMSFTEGAPFGSTPTHGLVVRVRP